MVKTLQLRQPMDQGSVLYDHIIAMGGSHNGKIWFFFSLIATLLPTLTVIG